MPAYSAAASPALADAGRFAAPAAQIVELGPADLAAAHDLDRVDHRRVERKDALDALAVRDLAHREVLVEAAAGAADADALIGLHARPLALDHLDVDDHRVAGREIGDVLFGGKLRHLLFFELLDQIHGNSLDICGGDPGHSGSRQLVRGCFYAKLAGLSPRPHRGAHPAPNRRLTPRFIRSFSLSGRM